jgi:hypothetical protein
MMLVGAAQRQRTRRHWAAHKSSLEAGDALLNGARPT